MIVAITIIVSIIISIFFLDVKLNIKEIRIVTDEQYNKKGSHCNIQIAVYLFSKIKVFWKEIDSKKINKLQTNLIINKYKKTIGAIDFDTIKILKKLKFKLEQIDINIKYATNSPIITAYITPIIATIISILIAKFARSNHLTQNNIKRKYKYNIIPTFANKNFIDLKLNCIISVKSVHIINMLYILIKKVRSDKNERTSNRSTYGYRYE